MGGGTHVSSNALRGFSKMSTNPIHEKAVPLLELPGLIQCRVEVTIQSALDEGWLTLPLCFKGWHQFQGWGTTRINPEVVRSRNPFALKICKQVPVPET